MWCGTMVNVRWCKFSNCHKGYRNLSLSTKNNKDCYFITTPIFYVNASPHLGHLYTAVIADALQRFQRLVYGTKCIFSTGTDEHGTKVQQAAASSKMDVPTYCTYISNKYKATFHQFDVGFTDYVRTTDERHKAAVEHFWNDLRKGGYIYKGQYHGWYCVSDETFLATSQLREEVGRDGSLCKVSVESGQPAEFTVEDNYMFRLSNFQQDLLHWLRDENSVQPSKFRKQLEKMVHEGSVLQDLSVSRPRKRVPWGIPVPDDPNHTVYVWLDALVNYLTVAGYPEHDFAWPPDVHVVGKDILKFHGVYWPAFLIAAGLQPPRTLLCHSHWTVDGEKMSKSRQNVVDPAALIHDFTSCGVRYLLLREGVPHSDGNYSTTKAVRILNSELADTLGNLLNRCCGMAINPDQIYPQFCDDTYRQYCVHNGAELKDRATHLAGVVKEHFEEFNFHRAIDTIIGTLHEANRFFELQRPWEAHREKRNAAIHMVMETLRVSSVLLLPIAPRLAEQVLDRLGTPPSARDWASLQTLSWSGGNIGGWKLGTDRSALFRRLQLK
ncbi:methionine--tRNA ligase, mitochondrial isoform X1 [Schistocerca nitens]|uniref:methionine--tRNA ligase, mitochondrial isoform X1 n=2 Tax=Schistocerca nitens TaxID=7011 RepID=UPI002118C934|nr:methionine--tRNA ligase, mitochondrial isoform X1 [Schistocerca nitens]